MILARTSKVLMLEQVDPFVRTVIEFGEQARWGGEIGLTPGWSFLTVWMFSKESPGGAVSYASASICVL